MAIEFRLSLAVEEITTKVKVTEKSPPNIVYMAFHFAENAFNILTNTALDPVAKIPE